MNSKHVILSAFIILIHLFSLTGCHSHVKPVDESICTKCINFIEDGKTKKEEVLRKFDFYVLYKTFKTKNNTILIFGLTSWQDKDYKEYDLVLVFDESDILKKHSLVQTK